MERLVNVSVNPVCPRMTSVVEFRRGTDASGREVCSVEGPDGRMWDVPARYVRPSAALIRQHVKVVGAPGYEDFAAIRLEVVSAVDDRGPLSIIKDIEDEFHVIPSKFLVLTGVVAK